MSEHETPGVEPQPEGASVTEVAPPGGGGMAAPLAPPAETPETKPSWSPLRTLLVLLVILAVSATGVGWWLYYETSQIRQIAVDRLNEATAFVEAADEVVLEIDDIVRAEIDADVGERAAQAATQIPSASDDLASAIRLIGQARPDLPDDDLVYADALEASARERLTMLEKAVVILEYNVKAAAAIDPALSAWDAVVEAGQLSVQAVEEYNKLTTEGVTRSAQLTGEAEAKIRSARELFSEAATGFPEADFAAYLEYCDEKIAALGISKKANEAYLAEKPVDANTLSKQYNEAEAVLADRVKTLPASPTEPIADAYERYAGEATEEYFEARARATEADGRLREAAGEDEDDEGGPGEVRSDEATPTEQDAESQE